MIRAIARFVRRTLRLRTEFVPLPDRPWCQVVNEAVRRHVAEGEARDARNRELSRNLRTWAIVHFAEPVDLRPGDVLNITYSVAGSD